MYGLRQYVGSMMCRRARTLLANKGMNPHAMQENRRRNWYVGWINLYIYDLDPEPRIAGS